MPKNIKRSPDAQAIQLAIREIKEAFEDLDQPRGGFNNLYPIAQHCISEALEYLGEEI